MQSMMRMNKFFTSGRKLLFCIFIIVVKGGKKLELSRTKFRIITKGKKFLFRLDTHPAFTYGELLKRCGMKTSTIRIAPTDGNRQWYMLSILEVIFLFCPLTRHLEF